MSTNPKSSRFEEFIRDLDTLNDSRLTKEIVIDLLLQHFSGRKIVCSPNVKIRLYRENLAYQLLLQSVPRNEIAHTLVERLSISRQWAIELVNRAIDRRARELQPLKTYPTSNHHSMSTLNI